MEYKSPKVHSAKLIATSLLEHTDELDEKLERCYSTVYNLTNGLSERESNDALNSHVAKGPAQHEDVQLGLLYAILIYPKEATKSYRDMNLVSRDSLTIVLTKTNQIVFEKWTKLVDMARSQVLWFCKELVKNSVNGADSVCHKLLRQIAGGDITPKNIWLTECLLDLFMENREWLDKNPALFTTAVFTYLRVIVDHCSPLLQNLRNREVEFCVSLLREKFADCMVIGRDLVRLLQHVARIPEFESLWNDMMLNPSVLCAQFTGILQLLQTRTSRKYLISRLTPDMENKLVFLISKVKFGNHKRFQDWFQRQYLSTPESQSLRCDLIRYICAVFHPHNELLCSDIIPRWAVIGWLLTTCTSNVAASNAKLSLFYDWFLFGPDKDSIMNIEPAMLVMFHSIRPHPAITATLLDFLCRELSAEHFELVAKNAEFSSEIMPNFCNVLAAEVKQGVYTALKQILDKRVVPTLSPLFDNPKLDRELRILIRENFNEFCSQVEDDKPFTDSLKDDVVNNKDVIDIDNGDNHVTDNSMSDAAFSDDEDDIPLGKLKEEMKFHPTEELPQYETVDIMPHLQQLGGDIYEYTVQLQKEIDQELQCEIMDRLIQTVVREDEFDQDIAIPLAVCLCQIMSSQFNNNLFPQELDEESIEDSIGSPLFVMFRFLSSMPEEDPSQQPLLQLLGEIYSRQTRIGYHLLYFLKVSKITDEKMSTYKDFCKSLDRDLETCLMIDLRLCQEDDVRLFTYLMPEIYTHFSNIAVGNAELLSMIVSAIDGTQLQDLICQILQGHLVMFRKESFLSVLNASLEWETLEQYFLWQLIAAHNIPPEHIMPILPKLEFSSHAEALTSIMVSLKQECLYQEADDLFAFGMMVAAQNIVLLFPRLRPSTNCLILLNFYGGAVYRSPTADTLRPILCRDHRKSDFFTISILKFWAQEYEDKLAELIHSQIAKFNGTPKKRQRSGSTTVKSKHNPSVDQILAHLDYMRQVCRNISFLNNEQIQHALQHVQQTASETQKSKFSDLLALADDIDDMKTTRVLRGLPSRKASLAAAAIAAAAGLISSPKSRNKKSAEDDSDVETDSSEDEDMKPRIKKRKKSTPLYDDSD